MPYLVGVDEAGYGPNLGPLVISASVWHVERLNWGWDLYNRLGQAICPAAPADGDARVAIADSKALYTPAGGLRHLERGVLAALRLLDRSVETWEAAWQALDGYSGAGRASLPWHADYRLNLPLAANSDDINAAAGMLGQVLQQSRVRFAALVSRALFPEQFNGLAAELGNKSDVLSRASIELVAELLSAFPGEAVLVVCDKHGGRNRYGRILQQQFPDVLVEVRGEKQAESVYRWGPKAQRVEVRFRVKGESFLPTALASMASKYLRELAMRAFNDFWCARVEGLLPTAGYPGDARRFKREISATQARLGIDDGVLWRPK
jgi:ribonuclease HII